MNMKKQVIGIKNSKNPSGIFSNFPLGKAIIFMTIIVLLFLAGCAEVAETPSETKEEVIMSTGDSVADVENDINDVGTLDTDLDMTELDDLEKDLEDIDW